MWKGSIAFGLVTVPVSLYAATERSEKLSFHLLHEKDGSRIDYKRFCVKEDKEVPWDEIVKGYSRRASRKAGGRPPRWSVAARPRRGAPAPDTERRHSTMDEPFKRGELVTLRDLSFSTEPLGRVVSVTPEGDAAEVVWHRRAGHKDDVTVEPTEMLRRVHESEMDPEA